MCLSRRAIPLVCTFAVLAGLAVGCGKKDGTQPGPSGDPKQPNPNNPWAGLGATPDNEDPEVLAYFKQKGWKLYTDLRMSDGKRLIYLTIEDKAKPFEKVAITPDDYKMIAKSKALQVLDLRNVNASDDGLKAVANIPQMEGIIVQGDDLTDAGLKALAQSQSLDNVTVMSSKKVTDEGVKQLAAMPKLQVLYLAFVTLDGSAFEAFAGSKTLNSLTLDYVDGFTDEGAKHVAKIPALDHLKIGSGFGEKKLTAAGIRVIAEARLPAKFEFDRKLIDDDLLAMLVAKGWLYGPSPRGAKEKRPATPEEVQTIALEDSKVTDKGLDAVLGFTNAKNLFLSNTAITDEGLKKLAGFKKLELVSLPRTKVTGPGLDAISGAPVRDVTLWGCELTEDAFKACAKMTTLEQLDCWEAKLKPEWLKHLAGLPNLKRIDLRSAAFDDAAVKYLTSLPNLRDLQLDHTGLTDAGLQELLKLPRLESLSVDGTKVSKEAYQKAKKDHPKLRLSFPAYDK